MLGRWRKTSARFWTTLGLVSRRANFDIKVSTAPHSFNVKFSHNLLTIKLITRVLFSGNKVPEIEFLSFLTKLNHSLPCTMSRAKGKEHIHLGVEFVKMFYTSTISTFFLILHEKNAQIVSFYTQIQTIFSYFVKTYNKWVWRIIHRMVFFLRW